MLGFAKPLHVRSGHWYSRESFAVRGRKRVAPVRIDTRLNQVHQLPSQGKAEEVRQVITTYWAVVCKDWLG